MFYVKAEIAESITIWAEITDENVFTIRRRQELSGKADLFAAES